MGEATITSSLLPQKIRRERMWRDKTKWFAAAAAIFVAGTAIPVGRYYYDQSRFGQDAALEPRIAQAEQQATTLDGQWEQIQAQGGPDRVLIKNIKSLEQGRDIWPRVLQDINKALPDPGPAVRSGNPEEMKKVPRDQRKLVQLAQMASRYEPNITALLADDAAFRSAAAGLVGGAAPRPRRGAAAASAAAAAVVSAGAGIDAAAEGARPRPRARSRPGRNAASWSRSAARRPTRTTARSASRSRALLATNPAPDRAQGPYRIERVEVPSARRLTPGNDANNVVGGRQRAPRGARPRPRAVASRPQAGVPGGRGRRGAPAAASAARARRSSTRSSTRSPASRSRTTGN